MLFLFSLKSGQTLFTHSVLYLTVDQTAFPFPAIYHSLVSIAVLPTEYSRLIYSTVLKDDTIIKYYFDVRKMVYIGSEL